MYKYQFSFSTSVAPLKQSKAPAVMAMKLAMKLGLLWP
jgi:hypothetical protein